MTTRREIVRAGAGLAAIIAAGKAPAALVKSMLGMRGALFGSARGGVAKYRFLVFAFGPPAGTVSPGYRWGDGWSFQSGKYPCWQMSRIDLMQAGSTIQLPQSDYLVANAGSGASFYPSGYANEGPYRAFDQSVNTKYCWADSGMLRRTSDFATFLALDFGSQTFDPSCADEWAWYTADAEVATPARNPLWGRVYAADSLDCDSAVCFGKFDIPYESQQRSLRSVGYRGPFVAVQTDPIDFPSDSAWRNYSDLV